MGYLFTTFLSATNTVVGVGVVIGATGVVTAAIGGFDLLSKALPDYSAFTRRVSLGGDLERIRFYCI